MKVLSIFVDESGDFGVYDYHAPFYIISMVLHDQAVNIVDDLKILENELSNIGWSKHSVHSGPVIRSEEEYRGYDLKERQKIIMKMMSFVRRLNINFKSIYIVFCNYDTVKIYYDNGQVEVTRILSSVFNALLENVEFRKVIPADYRLFQVADLICTLKLTELKMENHLLSKSEIYFFNDERTLKKNYLKPLSKKEL